MKDNLKRILMGLLAVFLIGSLATHLLPVYNPNDIDSLTGIDSHVVRFLVIAYLLSLITFAVGGFIAQKKFAVPAMIYAAAEWLYGIFSGFLKSSELAQEHFGNSIPIGELFLLGLPKLLPLLLIALTMAAAGSLIGMKLFAAVNSRHAAAE